MIFTNAYEKEKKCINESVKSNRFSIALIVFIIRLTSTMRNNKSEKCLVNWVTFFLDRKLSFCCSGNHHDFIENWIELLNWKYWNFLIVFLPEAIIGRRKTNDVIKQMNLLIDKLTRSSVAKQIAHSCYSIRFILANKNNSICTSLSTYSKLTERIITVSISSSLYSHRSHNKRFENNQHVA